MTEWREGAGGYGHGAATRLVLGRLLLGTDAGAVLRRGVMSMLWMALITVFVLIEKVLPGPPILLRPVSGGLLVGWGLWLFV
jgi:hypothetical protein